VRVLLCLLSDQHVPNLLSVHHFKPDRLVLIESTGMRHKAAARHLINALNLGGLDYRVQSDIQPLDAEDNLEAVGRAVRCAFGRYADADWIVNLSGGTKPMSIASYEFFKAVGAKLVYINAHRPNELIGLDGRPMEACDYRLTVNEFLAGYGFEPRKRDKDIRDAEDRARLTWECARQIAVCGTTQALIRFGDLQDPQIKRQWDDARKRGLDSRPDHWGTVPPDVMHSVGEVFGLQADSGALRGKLDKYAVEFLTGGWLEVFIWSLLDRHADALGIWDVRLGPQPGKIGVETTSDFDVAFMHQYRLAVVECKSGMQSHDPGADVLHKLEAVVRQFRALGVNSYLATTSPNVLDRNGEVKASIRNRAAVYGSRIISRAGLQELAAKPDSVELIRDLFFGQSEVL